MEKQIGRIWVDSGQVLLGDPAYLDNFGVPMPDDGHDAMDSDRYKGNAYSYAGSCEATKKLHGVLGGTQKHGSMAVAVASGLGDGTYPVYADIVGGRVVSVRIQFIEED